MPAAELDAWQEYYLEEPFGTWRDNWHAAIICNTVAHTVKHKGGRITPDMFMYKSKSDTGSAKKSGDAFKAALMARARPKRG